MFLIDTHIHLDFDAYDADRSALLDRARAAGVHYSISIGAGGGLASTDRALQLATTHEQIFATVGLHPHDASFDISETALRERLAKNPQERKIVAIGETGLDYFKEWSPIDAQKHWFRHQIELAKEYKLPLIVHNREAGEDCLCILRETGASEVGGVFHCYSEDAEFAATLRELNFLVSFTGVITFKKSDRVRAIIKDIPLDQIMLETDGPYMAPEPYRGQRSESAHVVQMAQVLADVKGISFEEACIATTTNAKRLFQLPISL